MILPTKRRKPDGMISMPFGEGDAKCADQDTDDASVGSGMIENIVMDRLP